MIDFYRKPRYDFQDLVELVRVLRAPDGCPWDRVQTHESIRRNFLEEAYEACDAMDRHDTDNLLEELGDVLLHVVFHAGIETDAGRFTIDDVCDAVVKKMISRHPALFGGEIGSDWGELKRQEKGQTSLNKELDAVARSLPALWRAEKLQEKAEKAGYPVPDCPSIPDGQSVGEVLFQAVHLARIHGVDPEAALHARCESFLTQISEDLHAGEAQTILAEESAQRGGVNSYEQN